MAEVLPSEELVEEPSDYGSLAPGTRLGRYELLVPIARGGMARVWAARLHGQRGFQKVVALKTILPHLAREAMFERMFLDEARIASRVHHPNVCEIYELGEESQTLYLAMEWVSGESLARLLRATGDAVPLDPRVAARIVADACAGVHAAHELTDDDGRQLGVVHRDLSPHNILLSADGVAKVADFGVAKALGQLHDATNAGQLKGKLAYMAPEQITGGVIDRRSDVFSLGCVLYEVTTGQRPFRGEGDHQVMHAVLKGELTPPSSLVRNYPPELERIVQRALSPQAILRYATAERMRFALEELLAKGSLVTQSNVAQVLRTRLGPVLEKRKERIRQASSLGEGERPWSEPPGAATSADDAAQHRSGVKQATMRPLYTTLALDAGSPPPPPLPAPDPNLRDTARPGPPGVQPSGVVAIPPAPPVPMGMGHPHGPGPMHGGPHGYPPHAYTPSGYAPGYAPGYTPSQPQPGPAMQGGMSVPPMGYGPPMGHGPPMPGHEMPMHPHGYGAMPAGGQGGAVGEDRASVAPATTGQYVGAAVVGVLVAVLIGVGGFYGWRARTAPDAAAASADDPGTQTTTATGATPKNAAASTELAFQITPAEAVLVVDGRELPAGTHTLPRPPAGTTVTVVARAPGRQDATRLVDYFTTSPVVLALDEAAPASPPVTLEVPGDAPAVVPSSKTDPPARGDGSSKADTPRADTSPKGDAPRAGGNGASARPSGGVAAPAAKPTAKDPALPDNPY